MRPRVLIVEDEVMLGLLLAGLVGSLGMEAVGPARSGAEALHLLDAEAPDFALLDFRLSDGPGLGVREALHAAGVPFLWLTGSDPADLPPGDEPVLAKPFDVEALKLNLRLLAPAAAQAPDRPVPAGAVPPRAAAPSLH
ncbi:MAG TPA: response regulator [Azospirillaceae bacterium]|nr:response regulator [Azospirillaceae bacterium]